MAVSADDMQKKAFNPSEHLMQIGKDDKAKDYLPVKWRLVWFRSVYPEGSIETEMLLLDMDKEFTEEVWEWNPQRKKSEKVMKSAPGIAVFRAVVKDGQGGVATGTKSEKGVSFPDYIEKAETGAIGRALAALGYGTQFTGDEWDEAHRIVDSPVENGSNPQPSQRPMPVPNNSPTTDQQKTGIQRLCALMNKQVDLPTEATFDQAARMLKELSLEYKSYKAS